jgi:hypothetical protein
MAGEIRIQHNPEAYYRLRSAAGVRRELERRAKRIADACNRAAGGGDGFRTSSVQGSRRPYGRWRTTVITAKYKAIRYNAKTNALIKHLSDG